MLWSWCTETTRYFVSGSRMFRHCGSFFCQVIYCTFQSTMHQIVEKYLKECVLLFLLRILFGIWASHLKKFSAATFTSPYQYRFISASLYLDAYKAVDIVYSPAGNLFQFFELQLALAHNWSATYWTFHCRVIGRSEYGQMELFIHFPQSFFSHVELKTIDLSTGILKHNLLFKIL